MRAYALSCLAGGGIKHGRLDLSMIGRSRGAFGWTTRRDLRLVGTDRRGGDLFTCAPILTTARSRLSLMWISSYQAGGWKLE